MKKASSIILSVFMLLALFHFVLATHYCHGNAIDSRLTLSGEITTCNIAGSKSDGLVQGQYLNSNCCDNTIKYLGVDNNYFPSSYSIPACFSLNLHFFTLPDGLNILFPGIFKTQNTGESPPGMLISTNVDLSNICVFRI